MHDVPSDGRNNSAVVRPAPPVIRTAKIQLSKSNSFGKQNSLMINNKLKNFLLPSSSEFIVGVVVVDVDVVVVVVVVSVVVDVVVVVAVDVVVVVEVVVVVDAVLVVVVVGCISSSPERHVVTMSSSRTSPPPVLTSHPLHCD